jgi:hypothetical protein
MGPPRFCPREILTGIGENDSAGQHPDMRRQGCARSGARLPTASRPRRCRRCSTCSPTGARIYAGCPTASDGRAWSNCLVTSQQGCARSPPPATRRCGRMDGVRRPQDRRRGGQAARPGLSAGPKLLGEGSREADIGGGRRRRGGVASEAGGPDLGAARSARPAAGGGADASGPAGAARAGWPAAYPAAGRTPLAAGDTRRPVRPGRIGSGRVRPGRARRGGGDRDRYLFRGRSLPAPSEVASVRCELEPRDIGS